MPGRMTWPLLRAKLPLVCMVVLSFVSLLLLLQIRPPDRLDLPRSTIRLDRNGWDPSIAQATAPLWVPKRPPSQPPAQSLVLWTAPPTPEKRRHSYPGWALNPSNADDAPFLGAMINWWSLQKPMHSANMMTNTAPLRELTRSVPSPHHLCPQALPVPRKQTQHWISAPWISSIRSVSGPATGSLHCLFVIHHTTECATRVGFGNASRRLLSWKPARAVPGPKSGPRFFLPSRHNLCKARGVRVVGYLASGPTGAAILVLRQQVLNIAKLRGRHAFLFLFGVIAASPCCTWCMGQLTEVRLFHCPFVLPAKHLLLSQATLQSPCQLDCFFTRWSRYAVLLISAPMGAGSGLTWPLGAPRTAALLCPRITSSSAPPALFGACRTNARIFGSSPRSAPTGCRLLTENVYPHELSGAAVQVLSHTPWSSRVDPRAWDHGSDLTPQIAQCWTRVARILCLMSAIFQRHLSCSVTLQLQALLGLTDDTPLTEHHLQASSRSYPVSLHCPLHRLIRLPEPPYLWWLRLRLMLPPQPPPQPQPQPRPPPTRLPHMGRAHYRPDGTRRRTRGELEARAKKKAEREREAAAAAEAADRAGDRAAAAAAPYEGAEPEDEEEKIEVEIEVEEEEAIEELPVRRPLPRLRPAPKWGAVPARDRSRSPRRMAISSDRLFRLSKALTGLLRHRAAAEGLPLREDGFFEVGAVTRTRAMRSLGASSDEVIYAVQHDAKRRYTLQYHSGIPWIRAAQGHSQAVRKDLVMRRLRQHELPPSYTTAPAPGVISRYGVLGYWLAAPRGAVQTST